MLNQEYEEVYIYTGLHNYCSNHCQTSVCTKLPCAEEITLLLNDDDDYDNGFDMIIIKSEMLTS